jgi:phosphatidylserine/phosphatidylglycerophosphate/cardiolipin synthase-like enzyme
MTRFAVAAAVALIVFTFGGATATPAMAAPAAPAEPRVRVLFSPGGGCTEAIVAEIAKAKASIDVQAYSFTSAPIADAVAKAHARGVRVRVVLDKSQRTERYTSATFLHNHGVPTWIDDAHAIAHNKLILIDRRVILTGSFNFTKSAEARNAENLLIIENHPDLSSSYAANFETHLAHAEPYTGPAAKKDAESRADSPKPRSRKAA